MICYRAARELSFGIWFISIAICFGCFLSSPRLIGEIYRPPLSDKNTFNTELEKLLNKIEKEKKSTFLMGDYNINTLNEMQESETVNQ